MKNKKNKKNKKFLFLSVVGIIAIIILIIFIYKITTKNSKIGNNMSSQEIVDYILNINSYTAKITVQVNSNKNKNKYVLYQEYSSENGNVQEVLEPSNIAGTKIINKDGTLTIENTNLNLSSIFENYNVLEDNCLDLSAFINDCKLSENIEYEETDEEIIIKIKSNNGNKYNENKKMYINKERLIPTRLIIESNNQNTTINIEYNEIELK